MTDIQNTAIWNRIEGNWHQLKGKVQEQWGRLTEDEIAETAGKREQLAGLLQERYGMTQAEVNDEIDKWAERLKV